MKLLRKYWIFWVVVLSCAWIVSAPILVCSGLYFFVGPQFTSPKKLLYETDHHAVLEACRDLMDRHKRGEEFPHFFNPNDPAFPDSLRPLRPSYLSVSDDFVLMEMHGGHDHYGFYAYAAGSEKEGKDGGVKLIDGLWWYGDYP
jgi:hypothetical protein